MASLNASRQRQTARVQRVIEYLHQHSGDDIDSAAIAEIAHLSPYHWHRIYVAVTGESAVATLRRIRLERAANGLLRNERAIADVARECGFDNLQAFNRLFRRTYGLPPGRFRSRYRSAASGDGLELQPPTSLRIPDSVDTCAPSTSNTIGAETLQSLPGKHASPASTSCTSAEKAHRSDPSAQIPKSVSEGQQAVSSSTAHLAPGEAALRTTTGDSSGKPSTCVSPSTSDNATGEQSIVMIEQHADLRLIGLWHHGDYNAIGSTFERVMAAAAIECWPRSEAFSVGVYCHDPDVFPECDLRSFAGIPVPEGFPVPDGYQLRRVPGGPHASCLHVGPYALLPDSYRWLYRQWLRNASREARDEPCHEIYLNTPHDTPPTALQTRICLPLCDNG